MPRSLFRPSVHWYNNATLHHVHCNHQLSDKQGFRVINFLNNALKRHCLLLPWCHINKFKAYRKGRIIVISTVTFSATTNMPLRKQNFRTWFQTKELLNLRTNFVQSWFTAVLFIVTNRLRLFSQTKEQLVDFIFWINFIFALNKNTEAIFFNDLQLLVMYCLTMI